MQPTCRRVSAACIHRGTRLRRSAAASSDPLLSVVNRLSMFANSVPPPGCKPLARWDQARILYLHTGIETCFRFPSVT